MIKDDEILRQFNGRLEQFLESSAVQKWRTHVREVYQAMAGQQWTDQAIKNRRKANKPITTINRMAPIIRAIAGYEVLNRTEIKVTPRQDAPTPQTEEAVGRSIQVRERETHFLALLR